MSVNNPLRQIESVADVFQFLSRRVTLPATGSLEFEIVDIPLFRGTVTLKGLGGTHSTLSSGAFGWGR